MESLRVTIVTIVLFTAGSAAAAEGDAVALKQAQEIFRPLPKDMGTAEFPVTKARADLGRMLFFDPRFTIDANVSCATCHQPALRGSDGLPTSIGVKQRFHPRNAPTILNAALNIIHWRGSGQPDAKAVVDRLAQIPGYLPLFKAAFPDEAAPMTARNTANAISAYERTLVTPSPFDAYLAGDVDALSPMARAGLETFINTGCAGCHQGVGIGGGMYQKFGVVEDYWKVTGSRTVDTGRMDVTKDPADLYVFRVPSLRNVAMTPPYFHDGSVATLPEAVRIMARVQLEVTLNDAEIRNIVAFLESLTGELPSAFATVPALPPGAVVSGQ